MGKTEEPKGIAFFNIKSGDTHYAKMEPQIQAYINSSDMGINASRGQDYGWRLAPDWVKAVKEFKRDTSRMTVLSARVDGGKVTTTQILYHIYGEQLRNYQEVVEEEANPYEEEYLQNISSRGASKASGPDESENTSEPDPKELVTAKKASSKKR